MLLLTCASLWHWTQRSDVAPLNLSVTDEESRGPLAADLEDLEGMLAK